MFRTELTIAPATGQLPRSARVLTVGSCFADSIGLRLAANKVETLANPFGTVFQPLALARLLRAAAGEEVDWQQHLVQARGRWQSYDLHGSIGADSPVDLLLHIQELVRRTGEFLRSADVVLLTLGTAWAYRLRETGELVNNCHKQSADLFVKELLTPDEIINALAETHAYLRRINPNLRFVLTVSPVRHLKDTLQLNSVSKSVLRLATHIVSDLLPGVAYFPAYELLVDDLRDYRFYAADMLHPSEVAEDYVWEKFARAYFDADFGRFRKEWAAVQQSLQHRPLHAGAPEHRQFLESTREKLEQLSLRKVNVADELQTVRTQLAALPLPRLPEPVEEPEDDEERIDIGQTDATVTTEASAPTDASAPKAEGGRPPRLSPEEFRAQRAARSGRPERGRRDGRGKGQQAAPSENEQFQTAAETLPEELQTAAISEAIAVEQLVQPTELASALVALDAAGEASGKKKKRRSRGGAKRTARKHALRLAAEEGMLPAVEPATGLTNDLTTTGDEPAGAVASSNIQGRPEGKKSSVITKSVPVKRGGRRDEQNRVPRVPLFAEAPQTTNEETTVETPEAPALAPVEAPTVATGDTTASEPITIEANSRNRRNRGKKPNQNIATTDIETSTVATPSSLADAAEILTETSAAGTEATEATPAIVSAPAASRRSARAKRAIAGGRAEKPAVDTPVIPVSAVSMARTQVAAGRMLGSDASLIEPTEMKPIAKKAAGPKKVAVTKAEAAKQVAAPKIAVSKAKGTKTIAAATEPEAPAASAALPTAPATEEPAAKPAAKTKPAAKPKAPAKAKTPAKATEPVAAPAAEPTASAKPKPAAKAKKAVPKAAAAKPAAEPKPKAPRKPNKPA